MFRVNASSLWPKNSRVSQPGLPRYMVSKGLSAWGNEGPNSWHFLTSCHGLGSSGLSQRFACPYGLHRWLAPSNLHIIREAYTPSHLRIGARSPPVALAVDRTEILWLSKNPSTSPDVVPTTKCSSLPTSAIVFRRLRKSLIWLKYSKTKVWYASLVHLCECCRGFYFGVSWYGYETLPFLCQIPERIRVLSICDFRSLAVKGHGMSGPVPHMAVIRK